MEAILLDELHKDINNKEFVVRCNVLARRLEAAGMTLEILPDLQGAPGNMPPNVICIQQFATMNDLEYAVNMRLVGFQYGAPQYVQSLLDQLKEK